MSDLLFKLLAWNTEVPCLTRPSLGLNCYGQLLACRLLGKNMWGTPWNFFLVNWVGLPAIGACIRENVSLSEFVFECIAILTWALLLAGEMDHVNCNNSSTISVLTRSSQKTKLLWTGWNCFSFSAATSVFALWRKNCREKANIPVAPDRLISDPHRKALCVSLWLIVWQWIIIARHFCLSTRATFCAEPWLGCATALLHQRLGWPVNPNGCFFQVRSPCRQIRHLVLVTLFYHYFRLSQSLEFFSVKHLRCGCFTSAPFPWLASSWFVTFHHQAVTSQFHGTLEFHSQKTCVFPSHLAHMFHHPHVTIVYCRPLVGLFCALLLVCYDIQIRARPKSCSDVTCHNLIFSKHCVRWAVPLVSESRFQRFVAHRNPANKSGLMFTLESSRDCLTKGT